MTAVNNVGHVLLLIRERLARTDPSRSAGKEKTGRTAEVAAGPLDRVRAMDSLTSMSDEDARRTVVHGILAEQFGEAVANDASFQSLVDEVADAISATDEGRNLMAEALQQLSA